MSVMASRPVGYLPSESKRINPSYGRIGSVHAAFGLRLPRDCFVIRLAGDLPGEENEEKLHRGAEPERRGEFAAESDARAGSADIGGKYGDEKQNESESSGASG